MELTLLAHRIYNDYKEKKQLKNWKQDNKFKLLSLADQLKVHNLINNFIRQDFY
jgi:hypothetical protein